MASHVDEIQYQLSCMRRNKSVKVSHLYGDGFLFLEGDPLPWIQFNHHLRLSVRQLELSHLEVEKLGDSIVDLAELTHLCIRWGDSLKCVSNVLRLHNLQVLIIDYCSKLKELPENMGDLTNLTYLNLYDCSAIKYLPNSVANLPKLSTLRVEDCESLEALPPNLKVVELSLQHCWRINTLPRVLTNLQHLDINICRLKHFLAHIDTKSLRHLTISDSWQHPVTEIPANLNEFVSLDTLSIISPEIKKLPSLATLRNLQRLNLHISGEGSSIKLDELPQLLLLDIRSCGNIEYLLFNQQNLLNLQFLLLPENFRLETLPFDLNDSVIISVEQRHIRETWKEIKRGIEPLYGGASQSLVVEATQNNSPLHALGYLSLNGDPSTWIQNPYYLPFSVRILDLIQPATVEEIGAVISGWYNKLMCLPDSTTRLTHLSLHECDLQSVCDSLENLNLSKLKLVNTTVESLPSSLCHLEIIHDIECCSEFCDDDDFEMCLKESVNLKTFSLTCHRVKYLPNIAGQQHLQSLEFKDCFNLRELMPNLDEFVGLCTLDVSGTRIKSLPEGITNLPNLQHLILPKCFQHKNLPQQFLRKDSILKIEFDNADEYYYKKLGYYDNKETSDEDNEITPIVGIVDLQGRESREEGIMNVLTSSSQTPNPSEANQDLVDFQINEGYFSIGESSHHGIHCLQDQEMGNLSLGLHLVDYAADMITQMGTINLGNDMKIYCAVVDPENNNNRDGVHNRKGNKKKIEITRDQIQSLRDEHISLVEAAKKLGVSRSTMKRRCKELGLGEWPSSRKKKSDFTKKRKLNTKSPSRGEPSQPNLVENMNLYGPECLDVNQHNLSDHVALELDFFDDLEFDFLDKSTANTTTENVGGLNEAIHRHVNVHETIPECTIGTELHTLLDNVQDSSTARSFDIKASYKDDIVRFEWSTNASLEQLKKAVVYHLDIESNGFKLKYQDEENDWVLINKNEHVKRALTSVKNNILRLKVTDL